MPVSVQDQIDVERRRRFEESCGRGEIHQRFVGHAEKPLSFAGRLRQWMMMQRQYAHQVFRRLGIVGAATRIPWLPASSTLSRAEIRDKAL